MSKYDWSNPNQRYIEEIAYSRSLEEARRAFGFPTSLPEDATLSAALAETFAGGSRPVFNVIGFTNGVVINDGVGEATTAIQAAIEAAYAAGNGVVFIPRGIYKLSALQADNYTLLKLRSGVSIVGEGHASILKVANGVRTTSTGTAVLYNHTEALSDIVLRDFCIDFNGQNNLFIAGYSTTAGVNRCGGGAGCTNVLVDNLLLKNSAGYHFLFFDGIGGSNVKVKNCTFQECGDSIAGNQITDHSSIYCTSDRSEIAGNSFFNANVANIPTAIETHGSDTSVHDNAIRTYSVGWNCCAQVQSTSGLDFHDNVVRNTRTGVQLWSSAAFVLSNVSIHDNKFGLREATGGYAPGRAVYAAFTTMGSSANGVGLSIQNNEIFSETLAQLTLLTVGIDVYRWNDVQIDGNRIHDLVAEAILVSSENAPNRTLSRVTILNNEIRDVGLTSTAANKRAIALTSFTNLAAALDTIDVRTNRFIATAAPAAGTPAACALEFTVGWFPNTRIVNNPMIGFTGASPIKKGTVDAANLFLVIGEGAYEPFNNIKASMGSEWLYTGASPFKKSAASHTPSDGNSDVWRVVNNDRISADNGDNAKVLTDGDEQYQYWNTPLTAQRNVTLPAASLANNGRRFHIRRGLGATGAFNLNIGGGAAVLTAAGQQAIFISNGVAYFLVLQ